MNGIFLNWISHKNGLKYSPQGRADCVMLFGHGQGTRLICAWQSVRMLRGRRKGNLEEASWVFWKVPHSPTPLLIHTSPTISSLIHRLLFLSQVMWQLPLFSFLLIHFILVRSITTFHYTFQPAHPHLCPLSFHWQIPLFGAHHYDSVSFWRIKLLKH